MIRTEATQLIATFHLNPPIACLTIRNCDTNYPGIMYLTYAISRFTSALQRPSWCFRICITTARHQLNRVATLMLCNAGWHSAAHQELPNCFAVSAALSLRLCSVLALEQKYVSPIALSCDGRIIGAICPFLLLAQRYKPKNFSLR